MKDKMMEGLNEQAVNQASTSVSGSNGGKLVALALGALGVLGGFAAAKFIKNKKAKNEVEEAEIVESDEIVENNE